MILFIIIFLYAFHPFSFLLGVFCKYPEFFFSNLMTGGWMDSRSIVILIKFSIKIHKLSKILFQTRKILKIILIISSQSIFSPPSLFSFVFPKIEKIRLFQRPQFSSKNHSSDQKKIPIVSWNIFNQFLTSFQTISPFINNLCGEEEVGKINFPDRECDIRDSKISPNTILQSDVRHFDLQMQFHNFSTISSLTRWKRPEDVQARRGRGEEISGVYVALSSR